MALIKTDNIFDPAKIEYELILNISKSGTYECKPGDIVYVTAYKTTTEAKNLTLLAGMDQFWWTDSSNSHLYICNSTSFTITASSSLIIWQFRPTLQ